METVHVVIEANDSSSAVGRSITLFYYYAIVYTCFL